MDELSCLQGAHDPSKRAGKRFGSVFFEPEFESLPR
jgi:hypothetical protein